MTTKLVCVYVAYRERCMDLGRWVCGCQSGRKRPEFTLPGTSADFSLEQAKEEHSGCKEKSS